MCDWTNSSDFQFQSKSYIRLRDAKFGFKSVGKNVFLKRCSSNSLFMTASVQIQEIKVMGSCVNSQENLFKCECIVCESDSSGSCKGSSSFLTEAHEKSS